MKSSTKLKSSIDDLREAAAGVVPEDRLDKARDLVRELREHELEAGEVEQELTDLKQTILKMKEHTIPDFFDEAGVPGITLAAEGNMPAYEVRIDDRYFANIPIENQEEAFNYLRQTNNEDLIKTTFTITFGLKEAKEATRFARSLEKAGISYTEKHGVPWSTLTAWFKTEHKKKPLPVKARDLLGATVGRVAKIIKQKERK